MMKIINPILLLFFLSCNNNELISYDEVRKEYSNFLIYQNNASLEKSYSSLQEVQDFKNYGLTEENFDLVIPIFIAMEKYNELYDLLDKNEVLSEYYTNFYLNYVKALEFRCNDISKSNFFIQKDLNLIKNQINENQNDSTLFIDYYTTKLYISDLSSVLEQIDSLKEVNKNFTSDFYTKILKESVMEAEIKIKKCD